MGVCKEHIGGRDSILYKGLKPTHDPFSSALVSLVLVVVNMYFAIIYLASSNINVELRAIQLFVYTTRSDFTTKRYNVFLSTALETEGSSISFFFPTLKPTACEKSLFSTHHTSHCHILASKKSNGSHASSTSTDTYDAR